MRRFGWMRLACLFLVLTVLAALVRLDGGGAGARSLAARVPDAMFLASERPEEPPATPRTEAQISSLEDVSEDALRMGVGPTPPTRPGFRRQEAETQAKEKARTELSTEPPVFYRSASPGAPAGSGGLESITRLPHAMGGPPA